MNSKTAKLAPTGNGSIELKVSGKDTGGAMSMLRQTLPPGGATSTHIHHNCEETVYPLVGNPTMTIDGNAFELALGETAVVPRGTPHAIANRSNEEIEFLFIVTPGGIEEFFEKSAANKDRDPTTEASRVKSLAMEYGVEIVAPPAA